MFVDGLRLEVFDGGVAVAYLGNQQGVSYTVRCWLWRCIWLMCVYGGHKKRIAERHHGECGAVPDVWSPGRRIMGAVSPGT